MHKEVKDLALARATIDIMARRAQDILIELEKGDEIALKNVKYDLKNIIKRGSEFLGDMEESYGRLPRISEGKMKKKIKYGVGKKKLDVGKLGFGKLTSQYQVSEDTEIELDGKKYLLEKGDKVVIEGHGQRKKRDGTGPYKGSYRRSKSNIGRRKAAGEKCPVQTEAYNLKLGEVKFDENQIKELNEMADDIVEEMPAVEDMMEGMMAVETLYPEIDVNDEEYSVAYDAIRTYLVNRVKSLWEVKGV
ncbi:MAG: hypothetical protein GF411_08775 [Candidatus Lokiarchaeota archaeon]|nr:hypothetical protein [Candidatus Lokiarchaeota archaeon]